MSSSAEDLPSSCSFSRFQYLHYRSIFRRHAATINWMSLEDLVDVLPLFGPDLSLDDTRLLMLRFGARAAANPMEAQADGIRMDDDTSARAGDQGTPASAADSRLWLDLEGFLDLMGTFFVRRGRRPPRFRVDFRGRVFWKTAASAVRQQRRGRALVRELGRGEGQARNI